MPEHAHYRDDDIVNPETRHEDSDVNVRALLWSVVIFIVFAFVTHAVLYLQFHAYAKHFRNESSQPLTMMPPPSKVPPTPRLQPFSNKLVNGQDLPPNTNTPSVIRRPRKNGARIWNGRRVRAIATAVKSAVVESGVRV